ncbi:pentatricopeptide repeat domain-containing protein [Colletotrichum sojae]|uniref:Pentatricopeptide repeat domain-containing protein n=1 Tax=Colletotrichum sojae TaxID=2175907 RepID=A0A8H6JDG5_9PEZI|nr:pentatricopeptide repeat domain-containing protein [Colletotrichum sojae]
MQALWSRAGQAHHCGCKACFKAAGGMVRQTATRVTPRKPTFSEVFTACYTGMMATAAVLDAQAKDKRRTELERQLEEAREVLDNLKKQGRKRQDGRETDVAPPGSGENRYAGSLWHHKRQGSEIFEFLDSLEASGPQPRQRTGDVNRWWQEYGFSTTALSIRKLRALDYMMLDRWLMDEESTQGERMTHRAPKTLKQLEKAEARMADLVENMVNGSKRILPENEWNLLWDEIQQLRHKNMPHYDRSSDMHSIKTTSYNLNSFIGSIFANDAYCRRQKISKVCHNLLVSPQPPTVFTYNTLILGLDRAGLPSLAETVVEMFYRSKIEPTRRTMACLLNHFRETGQKEKFFDVLQRMTGKNVRGMKIRRKPVEEVLEHEQLFMWAATKNVAINGKFVIERAWLDVGTLTAIIQGLLHFKLLRYAAGTFAHALRCGIKFSAKTISSLLEHCVFSLDTKAAREVLDALRAAPKLIRTPFREEKDQIYLAGRIQNLIDICNLEQSPFMVAPWLKVFSTDLPSEEERTGMRITSMLHQVQVAKGRARRCLQEIHDIEKRLGRPQPAKSRKRLPAPDSAKAAASRQTSQDRHEVAAEQEERQQQYVLGGPSLASRIRFPTFHASQTVPQRRQVAAMGSY